MTRVNPANQIAANLGIPIKIRDDFAGQLRASVKRIYRGVAGSLPLKRGHREDAGTNLKIVR